MEKNEELALEAKQLLKPLSYRSSLEPRQEFVNELHRKIVKTEPRRNRKFQLRPIFSFGMIAVLITILLLSTLDRDQQLAAVPEKPLPIESVSNLKQVHAIEYGEEKGKAGLYFLGQDETLPVTVTAFDIEDGTYYLLDEAKRQVLVVNGDGNTKSFPLKAESNTTGTLKDILVTPDKQIYILNTANPFVVYQYTEKGKLVNTFQLSDHHLFFPNELRLIEDIGVVASQNQEQFLSLDSGEIIKADSLPYQMNPVNRKEAVLSLNENGVNTKIDLRYEEGRGPSSLVSLRGEQILFTKTEAPAVFASVSETHVYAYDKQGETLGGIRIPTEKFIEVPQTIQTYIKSDKNGLYLLSPEKEHIVIYELTLGKNFESHLQEQVEQVKIGYDIKTFGKPFPALEAEIKKLFASGAIFSEYGDEGSVNGVAIDESGTAVIDLREFHAGSPSSYQIGEISQALDKAIFQTFPEVKQVYIQFDGSFSAWCSWMQITEEPWKRN
ncbi:hypothetical protein A8F94_00950 [Bacillus sp. FJAT-27225]|uniref:GerMN domain-containing protein n=1 Tax=Bacillus sp. FJAT-27225 TaxID=1743144 RepID=UPI00080C2834|nr:hypothetical protein [Bacillus sp. FJAT-27225]OCA90488.1 hypothetical protein A8F94_00950 [Bacillus sp. FJAT-27225]